MPNQSNMSGWQKFGAQSMDWLNLSGWKNKEEKINPYGALNPEQIAMVQQLGPKIQGEVDKGPQYYGGQLTEEMDPTEAGYYNANRANLMSGTLDQYLREGVDVNAYNQRFNTDMATPTYQNFNQNEAPGIIEAYSGFSTQGANRLAQMRNTVGNNLQTQRFAGQEAAKDRALSAYDKYAGVADYMAAPRVFKQAGLDRQYNEYVRGNSEAQRNINNALAFLGLSTGTYIPERVDTTGIGLLSAVGSIAGSIIGKKSG